MPCYIRMTKFLRGLLWLYLFGFGYMALSLEPGYLDFDNLPDTNFSCVGKVIGGYYADLETNCQMFHVCTIGQLDEPMDIRFLCLNGTVFDQETRVCERIDEVDCSKSEQFYSLNLELYGNTQPPTFEDSPETEAPVVIKSTTTTTTTTTTPKPKTTRPLFFTTLGPSVTTIGGPKVISTHHFPISSSSDIRFNPEEINISLNPGGAPPNIRNNPLYQQQLFDVADNNHNNKKAIVTTLSNFNQNKEEVVQVQRPQISSTTQKPKSVVSYGLTHEKHPQQVVTPSDINYEFTYRQDQEESQYHTETPNYQYRSNYANYRPAAPGQYRNQFKTSTFRTEHLTTTRKIPYTSNKVTTYRNPFVSSLKPPHYHNYRTEKPQRLQLPLPLLPTLPPLTFSSPAPFTLRQHIETKRYTNEHLTPPRIIISASASVSDASGRRLNYSLGTIGVAPLLEEPPKSYDDYKDQDVGLDPFYHDVPKVKDQKRRKRNAQGNKIKPTDVIRNEQEAVDVLKFLFDWYKDQDKATTVTIPVTPEMITEINEGLAPNVEAPIVDSILQDKSYKVRESGLFKRGSKYNIVGDVLSATEGKKVIQTTEEEKLMHDSEEYEDYVDDNYEPLTYDEEIGKNFTAKLDSEQISDETILEEEENPVDEQENLSEVIVMTTGPEVVNNGSAEAEIVTKSPSDMETISPLDTETTEAEEVVKKRKGKKKVSEDSDYSEINRELEEKEASLKDEKDIESEQTDLEEEIEKSTSSLPKGENSMQERLPSERSESIRSSEDFKENKEPTADKNNQNDENNQNLTNFESISEELEEDYEEGPETASELLQEQEPSQEILAAGKRDETKLPEEHHFKENKHTRVAVDESQGSLDLEVITETHQEDLIKELETTLSISKNEETVTEELVTSRYGFQKYDSVMLNDKINIEENTTEERATATELVTTSEISSTSDSAIATTPVTVKEELIITSSVEESTYNNYEETTTAINENKDSSAEENFDVPLYLDKSTQSYYRNEKEASNITTEELPQSTVTDDMIPTATTELSSTETPATTEIVSEVILTPVETTTAETKTLFKPRRRNYSRPSQSFLNYKRKPSVRHRFSSELSTLRPNRRKLAKKYHELTTEKLATSKITTMKDLITTSVLEDVTLASTKSDDVFSSSSDFDSNEDVPATDAPLYKSANPTQAESAIESLHTTPLTMGYRVHIRKEKVDKGFIFHCFGRTINKFYSDPRDCRLFHYCTTGYTKNQLLDMKFVCDLGTYFDQEKLICTKVMPGRCL